jgi:tryptophan synthase beta chain
MSRSSSNVPSMPEKPAPPPKISAVPDPSGMFGEWGGSNVPDELAPILKEFGDAYLSAINGSRFFEELAEAQRSLLGRPTPFIHAARLSAEALKRSKTGASAKVWLKREDGGLVGGQALHNAIGQALIAQKLGKKRLICEYGAGQHGLAVATAAAYLGLECDVFIAARDPQHRPASMDGLRLFGAGVVEVASSESSNREIITRAIREWIAHAPTTHCILGNAIGPHPLPTIVRDLQSVVGLETKAQCIRHLTKLPDALVACVNIAPGFFYPFIDDEKVQLIGVEAGGRGSSPGEHAAALTLGTPGELHGMRTYVLQDEQGEFLATHSCAASLCYPGAAPELAYWKDAKRVRFVPVSDARALEALTLVAKSQGIIVGPESAHAIAEALDVAAGMKADQNVVVCVSERGDANVGV